MSKLWKYYGVDLRDMLINPPNVICEVINQPGKYDLMSTKIFNLSD